MAMCQLSVLLRVQIDKVYELLAHGMVSVTEKSLS